MPPGESPSSRPAMAPTTAAAGGMAMPNAMTKIPCRRQSRQVRGGDESHLEQEQRQDALEQAEEEWLDRRGAVRPARPADREPADQQHDAAAEEQLVREPAPGDRARDAAGQQDAEPGIGGYLESVTTQTGARAS